VSVGATEKRVGRPLRIDEQCLERRDRARPHAAAGRGIEGVSTKMFNGHETEGMDCRLGDNKSWKKRTLQQQSEEVCFSGDRTGFSTWTVEIRPGQ
jgi:hypothetical protein